MRMLLSAALTVLLAPMAGAGEVDVTGAWTFEVETAAGSGSPSFTFKQEGENLTGTYKGLFGTADLTGTVKGNEIKISFKVDYQGQTFEITYEGKIEDKDTMKGTVKMSEIGEGTWTGKRH
jgi:hypothetical protein